MCGQREMLMGGFNVEGVEGRKGYPHSTERIKRGGGREKDGERRRWKKRNPVVRCI